MTSEKNKYSSDSSLTYAAASWVRERHSSEVARLYFSDLNVDALQDGIRYKIFKQTNKVISKQSTSDLVVTMRSIYLSDSTNLSHDIVGQVRCLNGKVIDFCVRRIASELNARQQYLIDSSQEGYVDSFMPRSENTSIKGHRSAISMTR